MYTGRQMHLEAELIKWVALLVAASAMVFALATQSAGQTVSGPRPLSPAIDGWSAPMETDGFADDAFSEHEVAAAVEANNEVWRLLDLHHRGELKSAIAGWQGCQLPCEREVWRFVALGVAHLQLGEWDRANEALDAAADLQPDHALVHYYRGMVWLTRADAGTDWYDRVRFARTQLVVYKPGDALPMPKGMCELAAMTELERAIAAADSVDPTVRLVDMPLRATEDVSGTAVIVPPTVGDLLVAFGADNFAGKAHNVLSDLYLKRGWLEQAEEQLDAAAESGLSIVYGYRDLGAAYEEAGQSPDAARAYLKAMAHGGGIAWPGKKAVENLGKTLIQNW